MGVRKRGKDREKYTHRGISNIFLICRLYNGVLILDGNQETGAHVRSKVCTIDTKNLPGIEQ